MFYIYNCNFVEGTYVSEYIRHRDMQILAQNAEKLTMLSDTLAPHVMLFTQEIVEDREYWIFIRPYSSACPPIETLVIYLRAFSYSSSQYIRWKEYIALSW